MNGTTEDLLRQALRRQAERAVDPDRVRAALPARAARRTRRRYGSLAGGLVAAAALTAFAVPVLSLDDAGPGGGAGRGTDGLAAPGSPSVSAPAAAPARDMPDAVAMRYKPTWLPAGLRERARQLAVGPGNPYDGPVRIWKRAGAPAGFDTGGSRLEFAAIGLKDGKDQFGDEGTPVDINGRPGRLAGADSSDGKAYVHWLIEPQTVVFIHNVGLALTTDDLLRIARSVQPDPATVAMPLRFGWLPDGMAPFSAQFAGDSATAWQLEVSALRPPDANPVPPSDKASKEGMDSGERWVYARLGRGTDAPDGGESIVVGGRPARLVWRPIGNGVPGEHTYVVVPLGSRLTLTVFAIVPDLSRADLERIAGGIEVGAVPDLSWLGA